MNRATNTFCSSAPLGSSCASLDRVPGFPFKLRWQEIASIIRLRLCAETPPHLQLRHTHRARPGDGFKFNRSTMCLPRSSQTGNSVQIFKPSAVAGSLAFPLAMYSQAFGKDRWEYRVSNRPFSSQPLRRLVRHVACPCAAALRNPSQYRSWI